ncbi:hypothetical protein Q3G72_029585 [Acer saccharum]|nr:hypothetical protein Q3G72_029585 [Acer saccharum]
MLDAIFAFPQERMILEKERSSGMYRLSSYLISRIFTDLPVQLILPTVFVSFTYYMASFKLAIKNFCHTLFIVLYSFFISQGLGLAIGALVMKQKSVLFLGDTLLLSFLLTSGFYIQNVPGFMAWIRYISVSHHTFKLLLGSQYKASDTYLCGDSGGEFKFCKVGEYLAIKTVGLDGQVVLVIVLAAMLVVFRVLAYIALMRIGVTRKQRKFPLFSVEYYKHILCLQVHY